MPNPFATSRMAEGYARFRPPVHERVIELVRPHLPAGKLRRGLDVGCGAGLSTKALGALAAATIGVDPVEAMVRLARSVAPGAAFVVGNAEAIPLRARSVDVITAAGALNYVDLARFFREAARVLVPDGVVVVYDFGPGKSFPESERLDEWFDAFSIRYPWPAAEAVELDPERLAAPGIGFRLDAGEHFEIPIPLAAGFYLEYMMTETNVASAIRRGVPEGEIRSWCAASVRRVWSRPEEEVIFRGYYAAGRVAP